MATSYIILPLELLKTIISIDDSIRAINHDLNLWSQKAYAKQIEKVLKENLPNFKEALMSLSERIYEVTIKYENDNYIEPEIPTIFVSSTEPEDYLKLPK